MIDETQNLKMCQMLNIGRDFFDNFELERPFETSHNGIVVEFEFGICFDPWNPNTGEFSKSPQSNKAVVFPIFDGDSEALETLRQVGYTFADITAKGLYGLMILWIAKARTEAESNA